MYTEFYHPHIQAKNISAYTKKTKAYTDTLLSIIKDKDYTRHESALAIPGDTKYQNTITKSLAKFGDVKHVVLIGIGGSSLGTQAVYDALKTHTSPTLLVLDALESSSIDTLSSLVKKVKKLEDIALVVVSKSGSTTETLCNTDMAFSLFEKAYGPAYTSRVIAIGDANTPFVTQSKKKKILTFTIPSNIGGRFSIFTAVGIVPLTLLKIDTQALREGAIDAVTQENLSIPAKEASLLAASAKLGHHTVNFFTFTRIFITIGYWYRQLLAESLGKPKTKQNKVFAEQLLPTVSSSIDLHSVAQLYFGGYRGVYTKFIELHNENPLPVGQTWVTNLTTSLREKTISDVRTAISEGVLTAYKESNLPYQSTSLSSIDARQVGYLLAQYMAEVMYLCHILNIDTFNQPNVELYKKHMREALTAGS